MYQMTKNVPNGRKIYQIAGKLPEWPQNIPTSSIARPSKINPNWDVWFKNLPPGNPASHYIEDFA
jgi:hypothetical protein